MFTSKKWLVLAAALLIVPAYAQDATKEATPEATQQSTVEPVVLPAKITFTSPVAGLQPEGVEWDEAHKRFLVGSLSQGTIYSITPNDDGTADIKPFIEDKDLKSTVGLEIDHVNNRLLVVNSGADAFAGGPGGAGLAAYDLDTGKRAYLIDFTDMFESKTNFTNDVAVDEAGNAYVTNSFAPVIYKVTSDGVASVLISDKLLSNPSFGANGIVYDPAGYLIVSVGGSQSLVRVTLSDYPKADAVKLDMPIGADGMVLAEDGTIHAVAVDKYNKQHIVSVVSDDEWKTAAVSIEGETTGSATTITLVGDIPYYINAYLGNATQTDYEITGVGEQA